MFKLTNTMLARELKSLDLKTLSFVNILTYQVDVSAKKMCYKKILRTEQIYTT